MTRKRSRFVNRVPERSKTPAVSLEEIKDAAMTINGTISSQPRFSLSLKRTVNATRLHSNGHKFHRCGACTCSKVTEREVSRLANHG